MKKPGHNLFNVKNKNIVISGAGGTLGLEFANALSQNGANVILVDIDKKINKIAQKLHKKYNIKAKSYYSDISNEKNIIQLRKKIFSDFRKIDGLINAAGYTNVTAIKNSQKISIPLKSFPSKLWENMLAVNLTATFYFCREFGSEMVKQKNGSIINIASTYGMVGADQRIYGTSKINSPVSYAASKGGIINLTRYLAAYWQGKNVRVNTLSPGGVQDIRYQSKSFIKKYSEKTMLGRMAKNDEYNGGLVFLLSGASSYMTGANLILDGGWSAW